MPVMLASRKHMVFKQLGSCSVTSVKPNMTLISFFLTYILWEGSFGENGYMYMYTWVPLLSTWNYHNIVNWLYSNIKQKVLKTGKQESTSFQICKGPKKWFYQILLLYSKLNLRNENYLPKRTWQVRGIPEAGTPASDLLCFLFAGPGDYQLQYHQELARNSDPTQTQIIRINILNKITRWLACTLKNSSQPVFLMLFSEMIDCV